MGLPNIYQETRLGSQREKQKKQKQMQVQSQSQVSWKEHLGAPKTSITTSLQHTRQVRVCVFVWYLQTEDSDESAGLTQEPPDLQMSSPCTWSCWPSWEMQSIQKYLICVLAGKCSWSKTSLLEYHRAVALRGKHIPHPALLHELCAEMDGGFVLRSSWQIPTYQKYSPFKAHKNKTRTNSTTLTHWLE